MMANRMDEMERDIMEKSGLVDELKRKLGMADEAVGKYKKVSLGQKTLMTCTKQDTRRDTDIKIEVMTYNNKFIQNNEILYYIWTVHRLHCIGLSFCIP
jgi:hypothetical protein